MNWGELVEKGFKWVVENWGFIAGWIAGNAVLIWAFIRGGLSEVRKKAKEIKAAENKAEKSAEKAIEASTQAQESAIEANESVEQLQQTVKRQAERLSDMEKALALRDGNYTRMENLLNETQETLERTSEALSLMTTRAVEAEHRIEVNEQEIKILKKQLETTLRQLAEAQGSATDLARQLATRNRNLRTRKTDVPGDAAVQPDEGVDK